MNQLQRNYIRRRVEGILSEKIGAARTRHTTKAQWLPNEERINLIRSGKVKLKPKKELNKPGGCYSQTLNSVFDFSKYEAKGGLDQKAFAAHCKKLRAKAFGINDKVMLGDAEEALKMIQDFENFEV